MQAQAGANSSKQVHTLQALIRGGFESHHAMRGVCAFRFVQDEGLNFTVHLEPGRVQLTPGIEDGADATLTLQAAALEAITAAEGQIDFRDPLLAETLKVEG